jgi:hypothetical protein
MFGGLWGPIVFSSGHPLYRQTRRNKQLGLMFNWLLRLGIIGPGALRDWYLLDPVGFSDYGVTLGDILARRETPEMLSFIDRFLDYVSSR